MVVEEEEDQGARTRLAKSDHVADTRRLLRLLRLLKLLSTYPRDDY